MSLDVQQAINLALPSWAIVDGDYRYALGRGARGPLVAWVMLNPSTADAMRDDPTVRKVRTFTKILTGCRVSRLVVVNLYALRSTSPKGLHRGGDVVGPMNTIALGDAIGLADHVVAAWGAHKGPAHEGHVVRFMEMARRREKTVRCLGRSADGSPRHPLMLAYATPFEDFSVAA